MKSNKIIISMFIIFTILLSSSIVSATWFCGDDNGTCRCRCVKELPCSGETIPFWDCKVNDWSNITQWDPTYDNSTPEITIKQPLNGASLGDDHVLINITATEYVDLWYIVNSGSKKMLCSDCTKYNGYKSLGEGENNLTVIAEDRAGNEIKKEVNFAIDTKKPKIKKTYPKKNEDVGSLVEFKVSYSEENLESVRLYYKSVNDTYYNEVGLENCEAGRSESCAINVDFSTYTENFDLEYYFNISDGSTVVSSKKTTLSVDPVTPVLDISSPFEGMVSDSYVPFEILVSEPVRLSYSVDGGKDNKLCCNCDDYDRTKSIKGEGQHLIKITAEDDAGNKAVVEKQVTIS